MNRHTYTSTERERGRERRKIPILNHVKDFGSDKKSHVVHTDSNQDLVPLAIERLVVIPINLASGKKPREPRQQTNTQDQKTNKHQQVPENSQAATHIRPNHTTSLHSHIVQRRRHRPRAHGSRVPTRNRHDDGVHIGRAHEQRAERPLDPGPRASGDSLQRHEYR